MRVFAKRDDGADEGQPDEEVARQLVGYVKAGIEAVSQHDIAEHHDGHAREKQDEQDLEEPVE
ncbi:hypothetical protein D3C87_1880470 [compost metagenome]